MEYSITIIAGRINRGGSQMPLYHFSRLIISTAAIDAVDAGPYLLYNSGMDVNSENPSGQRHARCRVSSKEAGQTLLDFLTSRFGYHERGEWSALVAGGKLLVNGERAAPDELLEQGDAVEYLIPDLAEPEVDDGYEVIDEDDAVLVVDKPGNLPTHPAGRFFKNTLWGALRRDRANASLHFVNRLDRETSGVVLLAKTPALCGRLARSMQADDCQKIYLAAVEGHFPEVVDAEGHLSANTGSLIRKKVAFSLGPGSSADDSGKRTPAHAVFRRLQSVPPISLVEVRLLTGRTHQIRATLEFLGFPLVGDKLYGVDETIFLRFVKRQMTDADRKVLRLPRQALHAAGLTVKHPVTGQLKTWTAPLPQDIKELLLVRTRV